MWQTERLLKLKLGLCTVQGMLSIGAAMLGSSHVIGLDVDSDALKTATANVEEFEDLGIGAQQVCINSICISSFSNPNDFGRCTCRTISSTTVATCRQSFWLSEGSPDMTDSAG